MAAVMRLFKCKAICAILALLLATGGLLASKLAVAQSQRVDPFNPDRPPAPVHAFVRQLEGR